MARIRVLPDVLASQVAAGEVVERPASVVKELVENSLDAGAGEVWVETDKGGAALIRVGDDGCGMSREDALLSLERHATSKLRTAGDLTAIRTMGFRGEAVPSIASVSRFRMVTCERGALAGTEILVDGGKLRDVREAGCAPGTVVEAAGLFYNMPARRKFMRAETTEAAHIEHQVRMHALAAPGVRFRLRRDGREVFDLAAADEAAERVRQLVGTSLAGELIALPLTHGNGMTVEGFVLPAAHARKGRRHQYVFLNGRPVEDAVISRALAEGFKGAVADGMCPAAWLWIDLEPALVDVNVHPAKREVRFRRPVDVRDAILQAVVAGLKPKQAPARVIPSLPEIGVQAVDAAPAREPVTLAGQGRAPTPAPLAPAEAFADPHPVLQPPEVEIRGKVPDFRVLGMLGKRYVVMESEGGLVLLDPRAAKERIYYEKMLTGRKDGLATQPLLVPVLLEMDPRDCDQVLRERDALAEAGVEIGSFGGNTVRVESLPAFLQAADVREFLGGLLDELLHDPAAGKRFAFERLAKALARRAASLVEPKLETTRSLLEELFACDLPYCTSDGSPVLTEYGMREIDRRFGK